LFFAIWGVVTKLSFALAALSFPLLEWSGFSASAISAEGRTSNPEFSLVLLVGLYAVAPVILKLVACSLIWRFPLGEAEHREVRERLGSV
jgi:Na+/melibiose symporter-like transporter